MKNTNMKFVALTTTEGGWWFECGVAKTVLGAKRFRGAKEIYRMEDCTTVYSDAFGCEILVPKSFAEPIAVKYGRRWKKFTDYVREN